MIPNSEFIKRGPTHLIKEIVKGAVDRKYTDLVIVGESNKVPCKHDGSIARFYSCLFAVVFLTIVHLPEGPTFYFKISSIKHGKELFNHGKSTEHYPELILNNFSTRLGLTVGRLFVSMFPKAPEFRGRQVVTFHCQRDFIFVRRHRYIIKETSEEQQQHRPDKLQNVDLQEIGPRFTLKLQALQKGLYDKRHGSFEFQQSTHQEHEDKRKFHL